MRDDLPPWPQYWPVLERLGDGYRRAGGGWNFRCPFPEGHKNGDASPSAFVKVGERGELVAFCNGCQAGWQRFVEFAGLPVQAWFPGGVRMQATRTDSRPVARYQYRDRDGRLVAVKTRWEPGFHPGKDKEFTWTRPVADPETRAYLAACGIPADAEVWAKGANALKSATFHVKQEKGHWVARSEQDAKADKAAPAVLLPPCVVGLYRLPEMLKEAATRAVHVAEGEGKADLLRGIGFCAVSGPDGKGKWRTEWGADFAGRPVVVWPDRDGPLAEEFGLRVCVSALYGAAASVTLVLIPADELPEGRSKDIKDWLRKRFPGRSNAVEQAAAVKDLARRAGRAWRADKSSQGGRDRGQSVPGVEAR